MTSLYAHLKSWLLRGNSAKLRPYELICLEEWKKRISPEALKLLDAQLRYLPYCQRQADDRLLCFWGPAGLPPKDLPREVLFPCQAEEISVARVSLRALDSSIVIKSEIILYRGRFFGLEFNKSPKVLVKGAILKELVILVDPMKSLDKYGAEDIRIVLDGLETRLPSEYLEMAKEGARIGGWRIYSVFEIRQVVQSDHIFYFLAENELKGAIAVVKGDFSGQLYYLDNEEGNPLKIQGTIRGFIDKNL